ncbi:MAG: ComEC/Rec2 family competence protein [Pseudomonadota bacterium]
MRARDTGALFQLLSAERLQLPLWAPVLLGVGIAFYFALPDEPPIWTGFAAPVGAGTAVYAVRRLGFVATALAAALLLAALGYALAMARAHFVAAPVLNGAMERSVEGRVRDVSRSHAGHLRLRLDRVVIHGLPAEAWPEQVRITLLPEDADRAFPPGLRVMLHARLVPPSGPVEPGGFDFRRMAWFDRLGGIGIARGFAVPMRPQAGTSLVDHARLRLALWRAELSEALREALPGETGSFAAAILVGLRAGLPEEATEALRHSNLAHLLAISGLHMGLLTGFVFVALRLILALIPLVGRNLPVKGLAAIGALAAGLAYLMLSGAAVATQRSFIMVLVVFVAVLVDRPAISMRSVALAAMAILLVAPESLVEVGFQMSFAATIALVAVYEVLRGQTWSPVAGGAGRGVWRGLSRGIATLTITALVAGLATAPISAVTFHQTAVYGLPANLLAVPLMGTLIMPAGALAAPLSLVGLEGPALWAMGLGIDLVLVIAQFFSGLDGAVRQIADPGVWVIAPIALGGLWLCLWHRPWRLLGLGAIALGLIWWQIAPPRPALLIAASGRQIGLMGPEGRAVFVARRDSWTVARWLEADGDAVDLPRAAIRLGLEREKDYARGTLGDWRVELVVARRPDVLAAQLCKAKVLLIVPALDKPPAGSCLAVTRQELRLGGALAVDLAEDGPVLRYALTQTRRLWDRSK